MRRRAALVALCVGLGLLAWFLWPDEGVAPPTAPAGRAPAEEPAREPPRLAGAEAPREEPPAPAAAADDPDAVVLAFVVAGEDVPIPRVRVQGPGPVAGVSADLRGVAVLSPELLEIAAAGKGLVATAGGFAMKQLALPRPVPKRSVIVLEPTVRLGRFAGLVVDEAGRPIAGARVAADTTDLDGDRRFRWRTETGPNGAFLLRVPTAGRVRLLFGGAGRLAEERFVEADDDGMRVVLRPDTASAPLRFRVVLPDGSPAARLRGHVLTLRFDRRAERGDRRGFELALALESGWSEREIGEGHGSFATDAEGWATVPLRLPGLHEAVGLGEGSWLRGQTTLGSDATGSPVVLEALPTRTLRGRVEVVEDRDWPCDHEHSFAYVGIHNWTLPDGTQALAQLKGPGDFETPPLPTEELVLNVLVAGHPNVQHVVPAQARSLLGRPDDLGVLRVPAVRTVEFVVVNASGEPVPGATLGVLGHEASVTAGRTRLPLPRPSGPVTVKVRIDARTFEVPNVDLFRAPVEVRLPSDVTR